MCKFNVSLKQNRQEKIKFCVSILEWFTHSLNNLMIPSSFVGGSTIPFGTASGRASAISNRQRYPVWQPLVAFY